MISNLFHFLVTSDGEAWDNGFEIYDKSRFLEYTTDEIASKFQFISSLDLKELTKYPCLCTYEGRNELRVAGITSISVDSRTITVHIQLDPNIPPISFQDFLPHLTAFGILRQEFTRTHWAIKEGGLIQKLHAAGLIPKNRHFTVSHPTATIEAQKNEGVQTITAVTEFIRMVMELKQSSERECFYRGQPDIKYRLSPKVFRTDELGGPLYLKYEHAMFREILISSSYEFRSDSTTLEKLVRMQHHGLPTRLLDITTNPLIALFFAVWTEFDKKENEIAEVILFFPAPNKIKYFDSDTASCIANLALMSAEERDQIKFDFNDDLDDISEDNADMFRREMFNSQTQVERLLHYIGSEKPYFKPIINPDDLRSIICVKSKRSNERITSQSGAFLLFGHDAVLDESGEEDIKVLRIRVEEKAKLLHELELLNITESTVFPNIVNAANDIQRIYKAKAALDSLRMQDL